MVTEQITREELALVLGELEMFYYRPGENGNDHFERLGEVFQSETGYLRPGKSYPRCSPAPEDRQEVWDKWCEQKVSNARDALARFNMEKQDTLSFGVSSHNTCPCIIIPTSHTMEELTSGDWCIDFTEEKDPAASIQKFLEWCDVVGLEWIGGGRTTQNCTSPRARYLYSRAVYGYVGRIAWDYDLNRADTTIPFSALIPPKETT